MSKFPFLPISVDAYFRDTRHLTTKMHGAYLLLIMEAWQRPSCSLPDNDEILARYASLSLQEWLEIKPVVMAFWKLDGRSGEWTQKRLKKERKYVADRKAKKRDAAAKGWQQRKKPDAENHALHMPPPPPSSTSESAAVEGADAGVLSKQLTQALGELAWCVERYPSLHVVSVPLGWLNGGCDLELDVLPAIRAQSLRMARRNAEPRSWKVFEEAVIRARDERLSPLPEPKSIPIQQHQPRRNSVAEIAMRKAGGQS